jgi:mycothiol synthase
VTRHSLTTGKLAGDASLLLGASVTVDARLHRRTVTIDDLDAVVELRAANDVAVLGRTDTSRADVAADLRTARLQHEGWYADSGALVAYGWVGVVAESSRVQLDLCVRGDADTGLGTSLLEHLEGSAAALAASAGHDHAVLEAYAYRQDARVRGRFSTRGFTADMTYTRMRLDFDGPDGPDSDRPQLPPGVELRLSDGSETDLRLVHRLEEEAFTEHYGYVPRDFDAWRASFDRHGPHWNRVYIASLDGEPVGQLAGTPQFEAEDNCGYVRSVSVLAGGRGRGVAKALLRRYFSDCRAANRAGVLLHVDAANISGALRIYESVGMRPVLEIDGWSKRVPALAGTDGPG